MEKPFPIINNLESHLDSKTTIITPRAWLANTIRHQFDLTQVRKNRQVWNSADVLPWNAWLKRLWENYLLQNNDQHPPDLLSHLAEQALWNKVIRNSEYGQMLLNVVATARQCQDAWRLKHEWQIDVRPDQYINDNCRAYENWSDRFKGQCHHNSWITEAEIPVYLTKKINGQVDAGCDCIILSGFQEFTPAQIRILTVINDNGIPVLIYENNSCYKSSKKIRLQDETDELIFAARWAKHRIENSDDQNIGVIIPELDKRFETVLRIFDEFTEPDSVTGDLMPEDRQYKIASGRPLFQFPLIRLAINIATIGYKPIDIQSIVSILGSPYLPGWKEERYQRANLVNFLLENAYREISIIKLKSLCGEPDQLYSSPILANKLSMLIERRDDRAKLLLPSQWGEYILQALMAVGWSEGREPDPLEQSLIDEFYSLFNDIDHLDKVLGTVTAGTLVSELKQLALRRKIKLASNESRLQIIDTDDALGQEFDSLFVCGMHEIRWPRPSSANPFIPLNMQQSRQIPFSTPELSLKASQAQINMMKSLSNETIFCSAIQIGDEEYGESPLISDIEAVESVEITIWSGAPYRERIKQDISLTTVINEFSPDIGEHIRGGSRIFKLQSLCPFKAFAEIRLGAVRPPLPDLGLNAMQRGQILHAVLESLWKELSCHEALVELTESELEQVISVHVEKEVARASQIYPHIFTDNYTRLEKARLHNAIYDWLKYEASRKPFKVLATEAQFDRDIAQIPVSLKVDRIDELEDGSKVLIDYKTGKVSASQWFGERPEDPQLPLYSLLMDQLSAVTFAVIRPDKVGFDGIGKDDVLPDIRPVNKIQRYTHTQLTWNQCLENWETVLSRLAGQFLNGDVSVDPLNQDKTCKMCELQPLCRIHDSVSGLEDEVSA